MNNCSGRKCLNSDAILGVKIPVLDDGFVRVVDYMGNDAAIVRAGCQRRQSRSLPRGTKTPCRNGEIKLHVRVPTTAAWIRDRTAARVSYGARHRGNAATTASLTYPPVSEHVPGSTAPDAELPDKGRHLLPHADGLLERDQWIRSV